MIFECNGFVRDVNLILGHTNGLNEIGILYNEVQLKQNPFITKLVVIYPENEGNFTSKMIYTDSDQFWNLFSVGNFFPSNYNEFQIILHRSEVFNQTIKQSIIKIIDPHGISINDEIALKKCIKIRDLIAWDVNNDDYDELGLLESDFCGEVIGYDNKISYFNITSEGSDSKSGKKIYSNQRLTQMNIGDLDGNGDSLIVLDPPAGYLRYLVAIDDEAQGSFYSSDLSVFESIFDSNFDIDAIWAGVYYYISTGVSPGDLLINLKTKVPNDIRESFGADIVIGIVYDANDNGSIMGKGDLPGRYSANFPHWFFGIQGSVIAHEVRHNFGLYSLKPKHCPESSCLMYETFNPFVSSFDSVCKLRVDPTKFSYYPYDFEDNTAGQNFPANDKWAVYRPSSSGTVKVTDISGSYGHVLDIHKSAGSDRLYVAAYPSYDIYGSWNMKSSGKGTVDFKLKPGTSLFLDFYSDNGMIQSISFHSGLIRRNGYPGTYIGTYSSSTWYDIHFIFDNHEDTWTLKVGGSTYGSYSTGGGEGNFKYFRVSSFWSGVPYGHIYVDDISFEFEHYYPFDFDGYYLSYPGVTDSDCWYRYANPSDGTVRGALPQIFGVWRAALELHKSGGTYRIYSNNYPNKRITTETSGFVNFILAPGAPLFLEFFSDGGKIQTISFYGDWVRKNGYPGNTIASYSSSSWYQCEFEFNTATNVWSFTINGVKYGSYSDGSGSGDFTTFRISSFYSGGGVNGYIYITDINYFFC